MLYTLCFNGSRKCAQRLRVCEKSMKYAVITAFKEEYNAAF